MADSGSAASQQTSVFVDFATSPGQYKHWRLSIDGRVARLSLDVREDQPFFPGYDLKLNSYDLGVDIELYDAVQRLRFEHPEVGAVVITSAKDRVFCAGANIKMLGQSAHSFKVNFCKFTNETRLSLEDLSARSGIPSLAACNGATAGGGYELALACDEILLIDDSNSTVSLPEVPLLAVLPGTGGLTRVVDKRKVRRDRADVFSTLVEGIKGQKALDWGLIDKTAPSLVDAVSNIEDGASVAIAGFGAAGSPVELIHALVDQGAKGLTVINNNAGNGEIGLAALIASGQVAKIICSYPRSAGSIVFPDLYRAGKIDLEVVPQGTLAERLRAAGASARADRRGPRYRRSVCHGSRTGPRLRTR